MPKGIWTLAAKTPPPVGMRCHVIYVGVGDSRAHSMATWDGSAWDIPFQVLAWMEPNGR